LVIWFTRSSGADPDLPPCRAAWLLPCVTTSFDRMSGCHGCSAQQQWHPADADSGLAFLHRQTPSPALRAAAVSQPGQVIPAADALIASRPPPAPRQPPHAKARRQPDQEEHHRPDNQIPEEPRDNRLDGHRCVRPFHLHTAVPDRFKRGRSVLTRSLPLINWRRCRTFVHAGHARRRLERESRSNLYCPPEPLKPGLTFPPHLLNCAEHRSLK
jgi:hypothetical protein